jgi:hypothetical protein
MDAEPAGKSHFGPGLLIAIILFNLGHKILSQWLLEPVALGIVTLLAFTVFNRVGRSPIPWTRSIPASSLLAVLFPAFVYGSAHLACGREAGALLFGLSTAGLALSMDYLVTRMWGEAQAHLKNWLIAGLGIGIAAGLFFYLFHEPICREILKTAALRR